MLNLSVSQRYIKANTQLQEMIVNELHNLLGRLFSSTQAILVEELAHGFSGTRVLKVRPFFAERGRGRPVVVKFGDIPAIKQEYANYTSYVQYFIGDGRNTTIFNHQQTASYRRHCLFSFGNRYSANPGFWYILEEASL